MKKLSDDMYYELALRCREITAIRNQIFRNYQKIEKIKEHSKNLRQKTREIKKKLSVEYSVSIGYIEALAASRYSRRRPRTKGGKSWS